MAEAHESPADAAPPPKQRVSAAKLYRQVTPLRRQDVCSKIIVAHVVGMFVVGYVPVLFPLSLLTAMGVLLVCGVVLTGPVYLEQLDYKRGVLHQWGIANKIAAVVVVLVFAGAYGGLVYWLFFRE